MGRPFLRYHHPAAFEVIFLVNAFGKEGVNQPGQAKGHDDQNERQDGMSDIATEKEVQRPEQKAPQP